jgi:hypothetical protein
LEKMKTTTTGSTTPSRVDGDDGADSGEEMLQNGCSEDISNQHGQNAATSSKWLMAWGAMLLATIAGSAVGGALPR